MVLGDSFPAASKQAQIAQRLIPGAVLYLEVVFPEVTKPKYLVLVASEDPDIWTFIVNTETNPFIAGKAHLSVCQVTLDQAEHKFLQHDSQIACHQLRKFKKTDVVNMLMGDMSRYKGQISEEVREQILAAVKQARTLSAIEQKSIIQSLSP
jgi:hypothetical protein